MKPPSIVPEPWLKKPFVEKNKRYPCNEKDNREYPRKPAWFVAVCKVFHLILFLKKLI
jgi:hypothetical protein